MTNKLNTDCNTPKTGVLPFEPGALDRSGLRLNRAEFARFLGVSKQAVGEWVTMGKITLGADGRLDPRQAVSQLIRNTDPARLRAKVLGPLSRDIGRLQQRVAELEATLAATKEDAKFHEEASIELIGQWNALTNCLHNEADILEKLPAGNVVAAVIAWLDRTAEGKTDADNLAILDCVPDQDAVFQAMLSGLSGAPGKVQEGSGDDAMARLEAEIAQIEQVVLDSNLVAGDE